MKRNKQTLKAARRVKTRPQWEARQAAAKAAAVAVAKAAQGLS